MQASTILHSILPGQPSAVIAPPMPTAPLAPALPPADHPDTWLGNAQVDDAVEDMEIDLPPLPPVEDHQPKEAPPSPQLSHREEAALDEINILLERFTSLGSGEVGDADPGSADDAAVRRLAQEIYQLQDTFTQRAEHERQLEEARLDERLGDGEEIADTPDRSRAPSPEPRQQDHPPPPDPATAGPHPHSRFPLSRVPEIALTQDPLDPDDLYDLRNPSHDVLDLSDLALRLALNMFIACRNSGVGTYDAVASGIRAVYPDIPILSYHMVRKCVVQLSGVRTVRFDMCVNSCTAYTGPRLDPNKEENRSCPKCRQPRFDLAEKARTGKDVPRQTFDTVLPGFALQAQFATPDHADAASYRARAMEKLVPEWDEEGFVDPVGDFVTGSDILEAKIGKRDICLMWSGDGFQLWELKKSDCYIYIWVLLDLPPNLRYKKQYVIPGAVIPGPNKPGCIDSFIFPGLYHVKALQKEGLKIWNAATQEEYVSQLHILFVTADTVAAAEVTGLVGHVGKEGCRRYCGYKGRRKPKGNQYSYPLYKPLDSNDVGSNGPDWDVWADSESPEDANARYMRNLEYVCASETTEEHAKRRLNTGIAKPSLFSAVTTVLTIPSCLPSDLMHWAALNFTALFLDLWLGKFQASAGDDARTWAWVFLVGEVFKKHGRDTSGQQGLSNP
ncbi:unnamed protein product [Peniophora sp. CBMAI 1063]|nr:unnamed protein product [Peniophora sp. CBMAI 1063]